MITDPITPVQRIASNHVAAFQNNQKAYWSAKANGFPAREAQGNVPAVAAITGAEYIAAMGMANIAALDAAYGAYATTS